MKRVPLLLLSLALVLGSSIPTAQAVNLATDAKDAVLLERLPYWNLNLQKKDSTHYKLTGKTAALNSLNYGILGVAPAVAPYVESADLTLTQGACNTLWGSASNTNAYLYAGYAQTQATSTSNTAPSTDISAGTATTLTIAVDKNPTVSVVIPSVTGLNTGNKIATELQTDINAALVSGGQGVTSVAVVFASSLYKVTSNLKGVKSSVVITAGAANDVAATLKLGVANSGTEVAGIAGTGLCVSNVGTATTVPSTAVGNSGYMSCSIALPSTTAVRLIGYNALNCTGPVIGTVSESQHGVGTVGPGALATSVQPSHVVKFAGKHTTTGGSATEAFTVTGVLATDVVLATLDTKGGTPRTILTSQPTADTITLVFSGDPSTDHVVSYEVLRAAN